MAKQVINIGSSAGDGTGDPLRTAMDKVNDNFTELYDADTSGAAALAAHIADTDNPHEVSKADVGLGNCDNTSDTNKPISTATQTALDGKAPLASPALSGTPTAPTAAPATNSTQIATTAYADAAAAAAAAALVASSPSALDTLNELAAALGNDANFATTVTNALAGKAAASHTHAQSDITNLTSDLAARLLLTGGTLTGALISSANGADSTPALRLTGTPFTGGTGTTTKPLGLLETAGATSDNWSTSGTMLGVNAPSGFAGNLIDAQLNGAARFKVTSAGVIEIPDTGTLLRVAGVDLLTAFLPSQAVIAPNFTSRNALAFQTHLKAEDFSGTAWWFLTHDSVGGAVAQRNGANAQSYRLYGTYTDSSNYRRLALASTTAGVFSIKPEGAGTGASGNVLHISGLPTSNPGPGILWNNAGTPAIGT